MFIILLLITAGLIVYLCWWYMKKLNYWKNLGIPHETPHWMLGSMKGVTKSRSFAEIFLEYYRKFKGTGPFAGFFVGARPTALILDPDLIKSILIRDFHNFTDHGFYSNEEDDPLSGQLFLLDGQKWRTMRNCLTPTFTSGKMKLMFPITQETTEELLQVMSMEIEKNNSILEVKDLMARFIIDVIGTCAFGLKANSLKNPNAEFSRIGKRAVSEFRHGDLVNAIVLGFPDLAKKLHIKQTLDEVEHFFINIVRDTVKYREENNIHQNDFLGMLIETKIHVDTDKLVDKLPTVLTLEQIAAQAFLFFAAGFETSSSTISFALYELAVNQDIQEKARQEVLEVLKNHNNKFSYESLNDLKYLQQIINETLRLYTNASFLGRIALNDYEVPGHPKYVIKKGMQVLIPSVAIHLDEQYYPEPEIFNPENFSPAQVAERDSCLFLAFGEGPRNCIGLRFAKMQIAIGLYVLLKNFKFSICEKTAVPLVMDKTAFFATSKGGIYLKVTKISNK